MSKMMQMESITSSTINVMGGPAGDPVLMNQLQQNYQQALSRVMSMPPEQQYAMLYPTAPSSQLSLEQNNSNDDNKVIDTPEYTVTISNQGGGSVTAVNKATQQSTKVWGDPHLSMNGKDLGTFTSNHILHLDDGTTIAINTTPTNDKGVSYISSATVGSADGNSIIKVGNVQGRGGLSVEQLNASGIASYMNAQNGGAVLNVASNGSISTNTDNGLFTFDPNNTTMDNAVLSQEDLTKSSVDMMTASFNQLVSQNYGQQATQQFTQYVSNTSINPQTSQQNNQQASPQFMQWVKDNTSPIWNNTDAWVVANAMNKGDPGKTVGTMQQWVSATWV